MQKRIGGGSEAPMELPGFYRGSQGTPCNFSACYVKLKPMIQSNSDIRFDLAVLDKSIFLGVYL